MKGVGINSIPVRFAILIAIIAFAIGMAVLELNNSYSLYEAHWSVTSAIVALLALPPTVITYLLAAKMTGAILALKASTEAIIQGDTDTPVEVDCACEVGGLADSFRRMQARFNANVVRMNIIAYTDVVTGLPNRTVANHLLGLVDQLSDDSLEFSLFFIDLDRFKAVNDNHGHAAGDELLRQASKRIIREGFGEEIENLATCTTGFGTLCQEIPEELVVARFAGDEFVAFLPGAHDEEALTEYSSRIVDALASPFLLDGVEASIGASVGIARFPHDSRDANELIGFADLAMYHAKKHGRGRMVFFDLALRQVALKRAQLEQELRDALARHEFTIHFQPKLTANTLAISGVEALVRWRHPERGLLNPGEFIDVAEQSGLIVPLGDEVLALAAAQSSEWHARGLDWKIAVNVSPAQFADGDIVAKTLGILRQTGAQPDMIELEITESMAMDNVGWTIKRLESLRAAGLRLALDDFGVGFSNLSMLARMPFDRLKLDRSLIADIGLKPKSEAIILAVIGMAEALGHDVVAEGIETEDQLEFLQRSGCGLLQGFLFSKPMPACDLEAWAARRATSHHIGSKAELAIV